ncbi:MAG TPA: hypothetical protein VLJ21_03230, partial [Candidatus Binatia bacterium]|nr:hypothetical protein [Candidatus Binatia bacterium]
RNGEIRVAALEALTEWTERYVKNKDLLMRSIKNIARHEAGWTLSVIRTEGVQHFLIVPHLETMDVLLTKMQPELNAALVVLNTRKNLDLIVQHWGELVKYPKLAIIFANPDSNTDKRWIIFPHTHEKIAERKSLKVGLDALFLTVEAAS